MTPKPYGHLIRFERRAPGGDGTIQASLRRAGRVSAVRRAAVLTTGFIRITSIEPFTREQWLACFGSGKM